MINGPTFFESIRAELREERKRQHLTLREVANRMETSLQYLNSLELGNRPNPGVRSLTSWSEALDGELLLDVHFHGRRK